MSAPEVETADDVQRQCTFVMFRGGVTGRLVTCGVCEFCRRSEEMRRSEPKS